MKRLVALLLALVIGLPTLVGCTQTGAEETSQTQVAQTETTEATETETEIQTEEETEKEETELKAEADAPKYIFFFIGDGMTYPQFQLTADYLGAVNGNPADPENAVAMSGDEYLNFMNFEHTGSASTWDSTSFCPDSASTATSMSTGYKTFSGMINMDETATTEYETIAEKLKDQLGYKVGIISSVNMNHATPAAFYAKVESRNTYYEIANQMIDSGFEYFAGGALKNEDGDDKENPSENIYDVAEAAGYKVCKTQDEASALQAGDQAIVVAETLADGDALSYEIDRAEGEWALSDFVANGIDVLGEDEPFFMMVEGGKIDWACHANDAGAVINDTLAFADAIQVAIDFAENHKDETLIVVTGDHETGGLTIGYAGTDYDTYLDNIAGQKISYAKYDAEYVADYIEEEFSFDVVMEDVEELFGLVLPENAENAANETLVLTEYELGELEKAYNLTLERAQKEANGEELDISPEGVGQDEYVRYGGYTPFSVTCNHILNNKSGVNFSSYAHTGLPIAVYAQGVGSENFVGNYDNTDIYNHFAKITGVK